MKQPHINIIVPLYNEQEVFPELVDRLSRVMDEMEVTIEVVMVDDGSRDATARLMRELSLGDPRFHCIFLSRNFGHQLALSAGLQFANASEAVFILDGDLQDPPEMLSNFYTLFKQGYDVVYGVRKNRKEHLIKQWGYRLFYRIHKRMSNVPMPLDAGDFSLLSMHVVNTLRSMPEESRFLRGMRSWVGFRQFGLEYERDARVSGKSKYSLKKLFRLAFNGLFNFTEFPIRFITRLGILVMTVSIIYFIHTAVKRFVFNATPEGFTALLFTIILFGGMQLIALGVIGEYILRIFFQVKGRPLFIVKDRIYQSRYIRHGEQENYSNSEL